MSGAGGTVRVFAGAPYSSRSEYLDAAVLEHWGRAMLLVPSRVQATPRRDALLAESGRPGYWGPLVLTLTEFAETLLTQEGLAVNQLGAIERRLLLGKCLAGKKDSQLAPHAGNKGMMRHLLRVITQLKQAAIEPQDFARGAAGQAEANPLDRDVAEAYAAYQEALLAGGFYDVPGVFWRAAICCGEKRPRILERIDTLVLDGFDDFTPSELRLLRALQPHCARLLIGVNFNDAPGQCDLYALPAGTLRSLREAFEVTPVQIEPPEPAGLAGFVGRQIFWRDPPRIPEGLADDFHIVPQSDPRNEVEFIAREVKHCIQQRGAAPEAVAVLFPNLENRAPLVREVFAEMGIPLRMRHQPPLAASGLGVFVACLRMALETRSRDAVAEVLTSPWWRPEGLNTSEEDRAWWPHVIRQAGLLPHQRDWGPPLAAWARRAPEQEAGAAESLAAHVAWFEEWAAAWPARGDGLDFARHAENAFAALGMEAALRRKDAPDLGENAFGAYAAFRMLLQETGHWLKDASLEAADWWGWIDDGMRETAHAWDQPGRGVCCAAPGAVRNLKFDYVFLGGLIEGSLPVPPPTSAIYGENEVMRLRRLGIFLDGLMEHHARERMVLHHVFAAAVRGLWLSWPLIKEDGRESMPSPFLTEIRQMVREAPGAELPMPRADSFVPLIAGACSLRDARNSAMFHAPEVREMLPGEMARVLHTTAIEMVRRDASPHGPYDGVLQGADTRERVRLEFGEGHTFSVNQLEQYRQCPFGFFMERVLGIREEEAADGQISPMVSGILLHEALCRFHRAHPGPVEAFGEDEVEEGLRAALDGAFEAEAWRANVSSPGLLRAEKACLLEQLRRWARLEREEGRAWQPRYFEIAFGRAGGGPNDRLANPEPFALKVGEETITLSGRIDRIDTAGDEPSKARIIDYKSGSLPAAAEVKAGTALQLVVYKWVLEQHLSPGLECIQTTYRAVGNGSELHALGGPRTKKEDGPRQEAARQGIAEALRGIRGGHFPPVPGGKDACRMCSKYRACRFEQTRAERKAAAQQAQ